MTRFGKWLRRRLERWLGRYYEGPTPPDRLGELAIHWANANPEASRGEFVALAIQLAEESYMLGYTRGVEYVERDPTFFDDRNPDAVADDLDPWWRIRPAITLDGDPYELVPNDEEPDEFVIPIPEDVNDERRED